MPKYLFLAMAIILLLVTVKAEAALQKSSLAIYVDGRQIETNTVAYVDNHKVWVAAEAIGKFGRDKVNLDTAAGRILIDFSRPDFRLENEELTNLVRSGIRLNFPVRTIGGKPYINLHSLEPLFDISYHYYSVNNLPALTVGLQTTSLDVQLNKPRVSKAIPGKINLVWDYISDNSRNLAEEKHIEGLDVLSPTWFAIVDEDGLVANKADLKYVEEAHAKNYQVWALITNSFDKELTKEILANDKAKENIIKQMIFYSSLYNLDGINIDFENIYDDDKDSLSAFVQDLTKALKKQNVTVSLDVTVPSNTSDWSRCYDREKLGSIVDYVMVMTYDEHWRTSPVSGPVASLDWVEKGVAATLNYVPKEKLLLGIPFYTREWEETTEYSRIKVKARTLSMEQAEKRVKEMNAPMTWLDDKGLYYTEYSKDDKLYRIWLEEERSVSLKAGLVSKYGLAGAASWRKDFEMPQIWEILKTELKPQEPQVEKKSKS
ncbi:MAG TPA: glycosyl hydrolase family 18 protein [Methylomusa anaerophila]|nr:glycosyl hydrolase family 18 protein [Methylomusa anaerophila]HML87863.1 glycosyl hydrolase family 18 protein [Methylomusa anaerophila]